MTKTNFLSKEEIRFFVAKAKWQLQLRQGEIDNRIELLIIKITNSTLLINHWSK
ncbi:hypothetical protein [Lysinibacillus pakistanensis]|uniref:hypothetical protein n=1 Tax=Lysinibacillus pakistanensis TaxID=759811 RepID=UPI003D28DAA6